MTDFLFAQSLIEYSAISGMVASASNALQSVEDWVREQNPAVLLGVGAVLLLLVVARAFRRPNF